MYNSRMYHVIVVSISLIYTHPPNTHIHTSQFITPSLLQAIETSFPSLGESSDSSSLAFRGRRKCILVCFCPLQVMRQGNPNLFPEVKKTGSLEQRALLGSY